MPHIYPQWFLFICKKKIVTGSDDFQPTFFFFYIKLRIIDYLFIYVFIIRSFVWYLYIKIYICIPRGLALCIINCQKWSNAWHKVGHNWHAWQRAWKQRPWLRSPHSPWCSHVFQASFLIDNSCFIGGNKISSESAKIRAFLTEGWQEDGIVATFPGNYMYPAFIRGLCDILSRG